MANIVLVPGAYHGGWYYAPLLPALRAAGHEVYTISLSGLDGQVSHPRMAINLDTHVEDVVRLIEQEQLHDVVLCGHSYAGMVITGAAERLGDRIRTLLFLDAIVPRDGDSVWSLWPDEGRAMFIATAPDGLATSPPPRVDPRARAHPLATFIQPLRISDKAYAARNKIFALCANDKPSPFWAFHDRLAADSGWITRQMASGHDFMSDAPEEALELILEAAALA